MLMMMNKAMNKSYESTTGTTTATTTATTPYSDNMDNNVKYMNLNFVDNSESSSQVKDHDYSKLQALVYEAPKYTKPPPSKILPSTIPINGRPSDEKKPEAKLKEKTLIEMGFKANEIEGWENIVQPPKENLYKLLKNMIDNHIKPNVQIRIGGVTFNCHMMVLQCYSDFFMECNNEVLIQLPEEKITPGAFMMVYDWMLADEPLVQREGILELFNAASFLRIKNLINQCWLCLDDDVRFREDTAFLLYLEARHYRLENLEQLMLTRICKFFLTLVASKEYLDLNAKEICTLLSSNTIGVNSEIEIFMAVVRWLSHSWEQRDEDMLNVVKCVRFSLMPPWFLVTLNKATDCADIDRIASHPEVKRMINDGISYTTTQLYYGENREEFLHFLERYQLVTPTQRQWVFDKECSYHHRLDCPNMQYITYKAFLEYLEMIQSIGKNYWQSLEMAKSEKCLLQPCCARAADARKPSNDSNAAQWKFVRKISRDCGVQVDCDAAYSDDGARRSQQQQQQPQQLPRPVSSVASGRAQKPLKYKNNKNNNSSRCLLETRKVCDAAATTLWARGQPETTTTAAADQLTKSMRTQRKLAKSRRHHNDNHRTTLPLQLSPASSGCELAEAGALSGVEEVGTSLMKWNASDWRRIKGTKMLVFGGVDPYCLHCMQHTMQPITLQQQHQQQKQQHSVALGSVSSADECVGGAGDGDGVGVGDAGGVGSGGCGDEFSDGAGDQVLLYDPHAARWRQLTRIPFGSRHHHVAVLCNGLIYIVGGTRTALGCSKNSKSIWRFDPRTLAWAIECTLPESRRDFAVMAIDERCARCPSAARRSGAGASQRGLGTGLLVIGGEGVHGVALDSVWFYDVLRKQWTRKASLNVGRYGFAATMVNSEIWIAGGIISSSSSSSVVAAAAPAAAGHTTERLSVGNADIITDTLEYYSLRCLSADGGGDAPDAAFGGLCGYCDARAEGGGRWVRSKLRLRVPRLFGRFCCLSSCELYLVGGIGYCRAAAAAADNGGDGGDGDNVGGRIGGSGSGVGIGVGADGLTSLTAIDRFDFAAAKWLPCGNLQVARHGHDVVAYNARLAVLGGVSTIRKCTLAHVELYDPQTQCVIGDGDGDGEALPPLPWPLSGSSAVALD